jgi:hypothetical protein
MCNQTESNRIKFKGELYQNSFSLVYLFFFLQPNPELFLDSIKVTKFVISTELKALGFMWFNLHIKTEAFIKHSNPLTE